MEKTRDTRSLLLEAAYQEMQRFGYRGASISRILGKAKVTKGALYYHFPSKKALGYAVVDELMADELEQRWISLLERNGNELEIIWDTWNASLAVQHSRGVGAFHRLTHEVVGEEPGFEQRLQALYTHWHNSLERILRRGQRKGSVRTDMNSSDLAGMLLSLIQGSLVLTPSLLGNNGQNPLSFTLRKHLDVFRPGAEQTEIVKAEAHTA